MAACSTPSGTLIESCLLRATKVEHNGDDRDDRSQRRARSLFSKCDAPVHFIARRCHPCRAVSGSGGACQDRLVGAQMQVIDAEARELALPLRAASTNARRPWPTKARPDSASAPRKSPAPFTFSSAGSWRWSTMQSCSWRHLERRESIGIVQVTEHDDHGAALERGRDFARALGQRGLLEEIVHAGACATIP